VTEPADPRDSDPRELVAGLGTILAALCAMHTQVAPAIALIGDDNFRNVNSQEAFVEAPPRP
jgi:hypothetical protein